MARQEEQGAEWAKGEEEEESFVNSEVNNRLVRLGPRLRSLSSTK